MFYLIKNRYIGLNPYEDDNIDANTIVISTEPADDPSSFNDWAVSAHGEYETIEEARAAIAEKFGDVRDADQGGNSFESDDESVVEIYKPGKYAPLSPRATADWVDERMQADITADTTDERIAELVSEYEANANSNGGTLHRDLEGFMLERRAELQAEAKQAEAEQD